MNQIIFDREATEWNEALPIGNGFLGAMIFGGADMERIQVNEDSVWSGGFLERTNPDAKEALPEIRRLLLEEKVEAAEQLVKQSMFGTYPHMRHYQTLGDIWIDFSCGKQRALLTRDENHMPHFAFMCPEVEQYRRVLNLESGMGEVQYTKGERKYYREFFASNPDMVMVYRMESSVQGGISCDISLTRKDNRRGRGSSYCDGVEVVDNRIIRLFGQQGGANGIGFELAVLVQTSGGSKKRMGSHIVVDAADQVTIYITARTTYRSEEPKKWCMETLNNAEKKNFEQVKLDHIADYQSYYTRTYLDLKEDPEKVNMTTKQRLEQMREGGTDTGLVNTYFNFAKYLLISSSREHSLPANLQGIWNADFEPMWGSKYTININIQMNYWLAEKCGMPELHMPLLEHLEKMRIHGQDVAREMYGARGFCCHHNTDIWGDCAPQDNNTQATIWPMGGAWLCLHIIEHACYTRDGEFIERFYPVLRDCVLFFLDYMFQDSEGCWVTGPSCSPENIYITEQNEYGSVCVGPTMDNEILRELFTGYLKMVEEWNLPKDLNTEVEEKLQGLRPLKIGKYGQIQEWQKDYEEAEIGHRHISQLFALYPGSGVLEEEKPQLREAARCTLERRLKNGGGHTGWSKAWIILFYARLLDAEESWKNMEELLKKATMDNLFDNHPPFQIDGNFGGACGILEMLVQDFEEKILLLPALPSKLEDGKLYGIHTKCGGILNLEWKQGTLSKWQIQAKRKLSTMIVCGDRGPYYINLNEGEIFYRNYEED